MRFIDTSDLADRLPDGWEERARDALEAVRKATPETRASVINSYKSLWAELKPILEEFSHKKCWYCESAERRSDYAVDHFRPKNRIAETGNDGYWWLAFDYTNYRLACTYCNSRRVDRDGGTSGGKQDHFPLLDESSRAICEDDCLEDEQVVLLDPLRPSDPLLLDFRDDGMPRPAYSKDEHAILYKRAEVSINLYHLAHQDIVEARALLFKKVTELVRSGDRFWKEYSEGKPTARDAFDGVVKELASLLAPAAELSSTARAALRGFRSLRWVERLLEH